MSDNKRHLFFHINKFQKKMMYPIYITCLIAVVLTCSTLVYFYFLDDYQPDIHYFYLNMLVVATPWLLSIFCLMLLIVIVWTYKISSKIFGPYERVLRELDEILQGNSKGPIGAREGDEMFEELLKRINILINNQR